MIENLKVGPLKSGFACVCVRVCVQPAEGSGTMVHSRPINNETVVLRIDSGSVHPQET